MGKLADGLYDVDGQDPLPAEEAEVVQGMVEGSNVQGIIELTRMIETVRSYSKTGKLVNDEHERLRRAIQRSEEHTSELQSLMRISYAVFWLKTKKKNIYNK